MNITPENVLDIHSQEYRLPKNPARGLDFLFFEVTGRNNLANTFIQDASDWLA